MTRRVFFSLFVLGLLGSACSPQTGNHLHLGEWEQNYVEVNLSLEIGMCGEAVLSATFTPLKKGFHLYSKDLPLEGLEGLGRPTLLELPAGTMLAARGLLSTEVDTDLEKMTYPDGPVTLRLPVRLPPGSGWVETKVSVTYMTCSGTACTSPVEGKILTIRVPRVNCIRP